MARSCRLRPASHADLQALAELERGAFADPWTVEQLGEALAWSGAIAFVSEDADGITGYVLGRVVVDQAEILSIAVRHFEFMKSPITPRFWLISAGPRKSRSTPSMAAISLHSSSASTVSI